MSLIVPVCKGVLAKAWPNRNTTSSDQTQAQFNDQDRVGVFEKTHENCIPTEGAGTVIEINEDTIHCVANEQKLLLARVRWDGIEAWSTWINSELLGLKGIQNCTAIYCRPVLIPGGHSLWLSFLPDKTSRNPLLDELYSRKASV